MILLVHMIFGAAAGYATWQITGNIWLAGVLALLSHYFSDLFPHVEYLDSVENSILKLKTRQKKWKDIAKVLVDFLIGILLVFLLRNNPVIYVYALLGIFPDGLTVVHALFPNKILQWHDRIHGGKIHYLTKQKKFSMFWRIATQVTVVLVSVFLLR